MIIGLSGQAGAGKDTTADLLVKDYGFVKVALADPMKRICRDVFAFSDEQLWGPSDKRNAPDERYPRGYFTGIAGPVPAIDLGFLTPRYALQTLGTEWGRNCYPDVWVEYALRIAQRLNEGGYYYDTQSGLRPMMQVEGVMVPKKNVAISDVRFLNEIKSIQKQGGKVVRLRRQTTLSGSATSHSSETEQLSIPDSTFDYVLDNSGPKENLPGLVQQMMKTLM